MTRIKGISVLLLETPLTRSKYISPPHTHTQRLTRTLRTFCTFAVTKPLKIPLQPISNFNTLLLILFIHAQLFSVVPLAVLGVVLKRTGVLMSGTVYRSPRICLASWRSFGAIVTLFACIAHKFVSSNSLTKYAFAAS